jgi:hypothetical protein
MMSEGVEREWAEGVAARVMLGVRSGEWTKSDLAGYIRAVRGLGRHGWYLVAEGVVDRLTPEERRDIEDLLVLWALADDE